MRLSVFFVSAVMFGGAATSPDSDLAALHTRRDQPRSGVVPTAAQSGSIVGRVADSTGQRLPGVTVTAIPDTGGIANRAQTGADGTYRITGLAGGSYRVDFALFGFDLARRNHVHITAKPTTRADGTLHVSAICECITRVPDHPFRERAGQVLSESGHPLPHARLHVGSPWSEVAYADGEGRFVVRVPMHEQAPLTASCSGFRPTTQLASGGASARIEFRLVPDRPADVADNEQLTRGCRCPGDLFTHSGR